MFYTCLKRVLYVLQTEYKRVFIVPLSMDAFEKFDKDIKSNTKRNNVVIFRLNDEEFALLKLLSEDMKRSMSDIVRLFLICGYGIEEIRQLPPDVGTRRVEHKKKLKQLRP